MNGGEVVAAPKSDSFDLESRATLISHGSRATSKSLYPNPSSPSELKRVREQKSLLSPEIEEIDDSPPVHAYYVGESVEIYSWSSQGWVVGIVTQVMQNEKGVWVQVRYGTATSSKRKSVLADDKDVIRPMTTASQSLEKSKRDKDLVVLKALLASKASVDEQNRVGETRLHTAAEDGHAELVEELLKARANPNQPTRYGCTPLHYAAWNGDSTMVQILLKAGADARIVNFQSETAADYCAASRKGDRDNTLNILTSATQRATRAGIPPVTPGTARATSDRKITRRRRSLVQSSGTRVGNLSSSLSDSLNGGLGDAKKVAIAAPASRMSMRGESSRAPRNEKDRASVFFG